MVVVHIILHQRTRLLALLALATLMETTIMKSITQLTMAARLRPRAIRPLVRAESWSPFRSSLRAYRIKILVYHRTSLTDTLRDPYIQWNHSLWTHSWNTDTTITRTLYVFPKWYTLHAWHPWYQDNQSNILVGVRIRRIPLYYQKNFLISGLNAYIQSINMLCSTILGVLINYKCPQARRGLIIFIHIHNRMYFVKHSCWLNLLTLIAMNSAGTEHSRDAKPQKKPQTTMMMDMISKRSWTGWDVTTAVLATGCCWTILTSTLS